MRRKEVADEYRKLCTMSDTVKEIMDSIRKAADANEHFENMVFEIGVKEIALDLYEGKI